MSYLLQVARGSYQIVAMIVKDLEFLEEFAFTSEDIRRIDAADGAYCHIVVMQKARAGKEEVVVKSWNDDSDSPAVFRVIQTIDCIDDPKLLNVYCRNLYDGEVFNFKGVDRRCVRLVNQRA